MKVESSAVKREGRVASDAFYPATGEPLPPSHRSLFVAAAEHPVRFGLALFALGWIGILIQASFLQQVVVGAPVFEEPAKVGLAIALVSWLRMRALWLRLPLALAFGAGFGVFEHYSTYAAEDVSTWGLRTAFHAASTVLSMAAFSALEPAPDVRIRWASTIASTLLHYANNFVSLVLGFVAIAIPLADVVATGWGVMATILLAVATIAVVLRPEAFRRGAMTLAGRVVPSMRAS